jgi:hypothetical protein
MLQSRLHRGGKGVGWRDFSCEKVSVFVLKYCKASILSTFQKQSDRYSIYLLYYKSTNTHAKRVSDGVISRVSRRGLGVDVGVRP